MKESTSAGGVVFYEDKILLLKKYNKNWVLPKGRKEEGENLEQTAVREVLEETMITAKILGYLGEIHYTFNDVHENCEKIHKTVYWYLMEAENSVCAPQKEEGFVEARFIEFDKVLEYVHFEDEKSIIQVALKQIQKKNYRRGKNVFFK